jgi:hypothetical protein
MPEVVKRGREGDTLILPLKGASISHQGDARAVAKVLEGGSVVLCSRRGAKGEATSCHVPWQRA